VVEQTVEYCAALACPAVHCLAGSHPPSPTTAVVAAHHQVYVSNLRKLGARFAEEGVRMPAAAHPARRLATQVCFGARSSPRVAQLVACLEPLNPRQAPHYMLKC
jgi:hydroxypyruvate isomerase